MCVHVRLTQGGGETELSVSVCVCVQGIKVGWPGGMSCTRPRTRI